MPKSSRDWPSHRSNPVEARIANRQAGQTLIEALGFSVLGEVTGVYTITGGRIPLQIALLQLDVENAVLRLFLLEMPSKGQGTLDDVALNARYVDVRQMAGACWEHLTWALDPAWLSDDWKSQVVALPRPSGVGYRHLVRLTTGDVACLT